MDKIINIEGIDVVVGEKTLFLNELSIDWKYAYIIKDGMIADQLVVKAEDWTEEKLLEFALKNKSNNE